MATYNLEDLLDEIQEDEVVDILLDTNELGALLKSVSAYYRDGEFGRFYEAQMQTFLIALLVKARSIREDLVRKKYPVDYSEKQ